MILRIIDVSYIKRNPDKTVDIDDLGPLIIRSIYDTKNTDV